MGVKNKLLLNQCFKFITIYTFLLYPTSNCIASMYTYFDSLKTTYSEYKFKQISGKDYFISNIAIFDNMVWVIGKTNEIVCLDNMKQIKYIFTKQSNGQLKKYEYVTISNINSDYIYFDKVIPGNKSLFFISDKSGIVLRLQNDSICTVQLRLDANIEYSYFDNHFVDENDYLWMIHKNLEADNDILLCVRNDSVYYPNINVMDTKEFIVCNNLLYAYEYVYSGTDTKLYISLYENDKLIDKILLTKFSYTQYNKFFKVDNNIYLVNSIGDLCEISNNGKEINYFNLNINYSKNIGCFWLCVSGNELFISNIKGIQKINLAKKDYKKLFSPRVNYFDFMVRNIQIKDKNEIWGVFDGTLGCFHNYLSPSLIKIIFNIY
jgi:hypothetical protein